MLSAGTTFSWGLVTRCTAQSLTVLSWKGSTRIIEPNSWLHTGSPKNLFVEANRDKVTGPGPRVNKGNADGGLTMLFSLTNYI